MDMLPPIICAFPTLKNAGLWYSYLPREVLPSSGARLFCPSRTGSSCSHAQIFFMESGNTPIIFPMILFLCTHVSPPLDGAAG